ncbi:MAG: hypothetical protein RLZZ60_1412 [Bacteroidota bacterium]|jgi:hypothetical protein
MKYICTTYYILMEISGRIIQKLGLQEGNSAKGTWKKQDFIIETIDKYPKKVCVSAWSEKVDDLNRYNINDEVKLSINIESREYNGRWYTDVRFWKIEGAASSQENFSQEAPSLNTNTEFSQESFSDDLPF